MLIQHLPLLSTKRIVLASASPRRSELLRGLGLKVEVFPSTFEENLDKSVFANPGVSAEECKVFFKVLSHCLDVDLEFAEYATETATQKAVEVSQRAMQAGGKRVDLIIAADTVVELNVQVLEKPRDKDDAYRMLSSLSGQKHKVYTGVALVLPNPSDPALGASPLVQSFFEETLVEFAELEEEAILAYIASGEPMDKAGAYGIQGIGGSFVKCIHGCYFNIMGFPVHRFSVEVDRLVKSSVIKA